LGFEQHRIYTFGMTNDAILAAIDEEISMLQQARAMLSGSPSANTKKSVGRPKGSKNAAVPVKAGKTRTMSAEGKARIAAAQKKRWAAAKKASK
jgi:hypothetical protein